MSVYAYLFLLEFLQSYSVGVHHFVVKRNFFRRYTGDAENSFGKERIQYKQGSKNRSSEKVVFYNTFKAAFRIHSKTFGYADKAFCRFSGIDFCKGSLKSHYFQILIGSKYKTAFPFKEIPFNAEIENIQTRRDGAVRVGYGVSENLIGI